MRALWNGSLSIGRVTIPVSAYKSAEHVDDLSLKTLHADCSTPLKNERWCPTCSMKLEAGAETVQGFEFAPGQFVTVSRPELEQAIGAKKLKLDRTVKLTALDQPMLDETYWLGPSSDPSASHAYDALLRALEKTKRAALGRWGYYSRERVAAVRPVSIEGVTLLGLTTLFPVEGVRVENATLIRDAIAATPATRAEISLCAQVVEDMAVPESFRWRAVRRYYPPRLRHLLEEKQKSGKVVLAPQTDSVAPVDLEQALRESVKPAAAAAKAGAR
jgi:DNA end-binding protein Ku